VKWYRNASLCNDKKAVWIFGKRVVGIAVVVVVGCVRRMPTDDWREGLGSDARLLPVVLLQRISSDHSDTVR
jgi:hypothetical protein